MHLGQKSKHDPERNRGPSTRMPDPARLSRRKPRVRCLKSRSASHAEKAAARESPASRGGNVGHETGLSCERTSPCLQHHTPLWSSPQYEGRDQIALGRGKIVGTGYLGQRPSRSSSPGHRPGERGRSRSTCRPNGPYRSSKDWPVGPTIPVRSGPFPQGVALGWVNHAPTGHVRCAARKPCACLSLIRVRRTAPPGKRPSKPANWQSSGR